MKQELPVLTRRAITIIAHLSFGVAVVQAVPVEAALARVAGALLALDLILDAKINTDALGGRRASIILRQIGSIVARCVCEDGKIGAKPARPRALDGTMALVWYCADNVGAGVVADAVNRRCVVCSHFLAPVE